MASRAYHIAGTNDAPHTARDEGGPYGDHVPSPVVSDPRGEDGQRSNRHSGKQNGNPCNAVRLHRPRCGHMGNPLRSENRGGKQHGNRMDGFVAPPGARSLDTMLEPMRKFLSWEKCHGKEHDRDISKYCIFYYDASLHGRSAVATECRTSGDLHTPMLA